MKCNQCDLPRYWTGQRENNKLVYACENGHPNLVDIPTIEEMCGFIPDMTEGLSLKDYMERISDDF